MDSRYPDWARWLGWTAVFGLVILGSALAYYALQAAIPSNLSPLFVLPSLAAAILIGVRYPSWWWVAGPSALILVPAMALFLLASGAELVVGWVIIPLLIVSIAYGFLALLGVWWGKRREDDFPFRGDDVPRDGSRFRRK